LEGLTRHVSREPRPGDRGRGFGRALAGQVAVTVATYRRLFEEAAGLGAADVRAAGDTVGLRLSAAAPELVAEVEGIASGAGQDVRELLAINARTELLAGTQAECTLQGRIDPAGAWLAQTWDWHPDLRAAAVVWTIEGRLTTVTEAGVLGKLGLNRAGVACGLNFLTCSEDGGLDGVPVHVLLRLVLERCETGADARRLLAGTRTSASACVTVASGHELFAAELCPGGARFVEPGADGLLVHTNHFRAAPASGTDPMPTAHPGTLERFARVARAARLGEAVPLVLSRHGALAEPVCRHGDPPGTPWAQRRATLLAIWAEPAAGRLRVAPGPPCTTPFEAA
jgi:isopenicillin-N N-acyltransferase-like protein